VRDVIAFKIYYLRIFTMTSTSLFTKINSLPENQKVEVQDFIDFLISKKKNKESRLFKR